MGMILEPGPSIHIGSEILLNISKTPDIESYAVTTDGTPPVLAKYIAYDNLVPQNPFIATVEDGLGKVLLDGGFPKWYNGHCDPNWTTYNDLVPSFKYLYDAISFIENKTKVQAGNKKVLILGDATIDYSYSIKDPYPERGGFNLSINKTLSIKGYEPTFMDPSDYANGVLDPSYAYLDQFCCVLVFSTRYITDKLITDAAIQSLIAYRESGNGLFIITDHGEDIANLSDAINTSYGGFFKTANYIVTNFGCYFTGNFDRTHVNVGYLRANYGNHPLWANLSDSDYITAGGSESKVVVTQFPLYYGNLSLNIDKTGYSQVQFLVRYTDGNIGLEKYTYGLNVPEIIYPMTDQDTEFTSTSIATVKDTFYLNFKIKHTENCTGLLKINQNVIGNFSYKVSTDSTEININPANKIPLYQPVSNNINIKNGSTISIQMISPLSYTKTLTINSPTITFDNLRFSKYLPQGYTLEFTAPNYSTSKLRNFKHVIMNQDLRWWLKYDGLKFGSGIFKKYFEQGINPLSTSNNILEPISGNPSGSQTTFKTYSFGLDVANMPVYLTFDFIEMLTWDGELFNVFANNNIISQRPFWNDRYVSYGNLDGTGKENLLAPHSSLPEEIHTYALNTQLDSNGDLKLGFGSTLDEPINNESFSIDNIALQVRFVSEDYESGNNYGWNLPVWDSQGGTQMLGLIGGTSGTQAYYKTYDFGISNKNRKVKIGLKFYKVDSWDGEFFIIYVNDIINYKKSFVGTSYGNSDPYEVGVKITLNGDYPTWEFEEYFNIKIEAFTDNQGKLKLGFGTTLDQETWDEAAAIDDITIDLLFEDNFELGASGWNTGISQMEIKV